MLNPVSFYDAAVKAAGYTRADDEATKLASAQGIPAEVAALARDYFYQTQIDGIPYSGDSARAADAMKMAVAYHQHVANECEAAQKLAEGITRAMRHAAEGYLAGQNIDLTADEALKVASLQGDPELVPAPVQVEKTAIRHLFAGGVIDDTTLHYDPAAHETLGRLGLAVQANPSGPTVDELKASGETMNRMFDANGLDPASRRSALRGLVQAHASGQQPSNLAGLHSQIRTIANPAPAGGKPFGGYGGLALAGGALGLGAMWYLNKKRREAEAMQNSGMALQRAATLPAA